MPSLAATRREPHEDPDALTQWYLWDGGFLALGRYRGIVPAHAHHAVQVVIGVDGPVAVMGESGEWLAGTGVLIKPDVPHSFDFRASFAALLFVDPESREGQWLCSSLRDAVTVVPAARLDPWLVELRGFLERPFEALEISALIRLCVTALCTGAAPAGRLDDRIGKVLQAIRASDDLRISLEDMAAAVFLSPSRFAHLFKQQVGLPFRRYMLWRKLTRAMLAIGRDGAIATAAQAADFADAAHLTRTFHQMFGTPPSAMMRGRFFEIEPPFRLVAAELERSGDR